MGLTYFVVILLGWASVYGGESSEEVLQFFKSPEVKGLFTDAYNEDKLDVISGWAYMMQDATENVSLVGTQNVYGQTGEIVEVRVIELHLPKNTDNKTGEKKKESLFEALENDSTEEEDDDISVAAVKGLFDLISNLGFDLSISEEDYEKNGVLKERFFVDKNIMYGFSEGVHAVVKIKDVESMDEVNSLIEEKSKSGRPVTVLKYNQEIKLIKDQSNVVPEHMVQVTSFEGDVNETIIDDILSAVANACAEHKKNMEAVPAQIVKTLNQKRPEYDFFAFLKEPQVFLLPEEFFRVTVTYDLALLDEDKNNKIKDKEFFIMGSKKQ